MRYIKTNQKNLDFFSKLKPHSLNLAREFDFIFLLMLMILDNSDNADYFLYKFNISNKDKKRIKILDNFYRENSSKKPSILIFFPLISSEN